MSLKHCLTFFCSFFIAYGAAAQNNCRFLVVDSVTREALINVSVASKNNPSASTVTNADGIAVLQGLAAGADTINISYLGYTPVKNFILLPDTCLHTIALFSGNEQLNEVVVVATTRTNDRIENAATKVEVIN